MTEEQMMLAEMLAKELMELEGEELIKFERILDTEMAVYDTVN